MVFFHFKEHKTVLWTVICKKNVLSAVTNSIEISWKMEIKVKHLTIHFFLERFYLPRFLYQKICRGFKGLSDKPIVLFNSIERNVKFLDR